MVIMRRTSTSLLGRCAATPLAVVLALGGLTASPATAIGAPERATTAEVTVEVEGTLQPIVVEPPRSATGDDAHGHGLGHAHGDARDDAHGDERLMMLVTGDGARLELDTAMLTAETGIDTADVSVGAVFSGELALPEAVVAAVADAGFAVSEGDTIDAAGDAAEVALTALSELGEPAAVAEASVSETSASENSASEDSASTPRRATAAAAQPAAKPAPSAHRLYVAVVGNQGSLPEANEYGGTVATARDYWQVEGADGGLTMTIAQTKTYAASAATPANFCGFGGGTDAVINEARAQFPGVTFSTAQSGSPNHLVILVPRDCAGEYTGLAEVGAGLRSGGASLNAIGKHTASTIAHELGHNLSLGHAFIRYCSPTCTEVVYGDLTNVMGYSTDAAGIPALSGPQREHLGMSASSEIATFDAGSGGSFTAALSPRADRAGTRSATIIDTDGARYWLEYRAGTGDDAATSYPDPQGNRFWDIAGRATRFGAGVTVTETWPDLGFGTVIHTRSADAGYRATFGHGDAFTTRAGLPLTVSIGSGRATLTARAAELPRLVVVKKPVIRGTPKPGKSLTLSPAAWQAAAGAGPVPTTYQWSRNSKPIAGRTGTSYRVQPADVGARITVVATASAAKHRNGSSASAAVKIGKGAAKLTTSAKASKRTVKVTVKLSLPGTSKTKTSGKVKVKLNGKSKTITVRGGVGTAKFTKVKPKKHTVTATYAATKSYAKATASKKVAVKR